MICPCFTCRDSGWWGTWKRCTESWVAREPACCSPPLLGYGSPQNTRGTFVQYNTYNSIHPKREIAGERLRGMQRIRAVQMRDAYPQ